jgi:hypothetical protein
MIKFESSFLCCVARRETSQWNCPRYERHYHSQQFVDYLKTAWHSFRQTGDNAIDCFSPYWKWCQWDPSVGHAKLVCNTHTHTHTHNLDDSRVCSILWHLVTDEVKNSNEICHMRQKRRRPQTILLSAIWHGFVWYKCTENAGTLLWRQQNPLKSQ